MKIGIMGAMPEEIDGIKELRHFELAASIAGRDYYQSLPTDEHKRIELFLVFSRWGKVASAITATTLINQFKVDMILFIGIAGAISDELNIGDVVLADTLLQYDMDASPVFKPFQIPLTEKVFFQTHHKLHAFLEQCINKTLNSAELQLTIKNDDPTIGFIEPRCFTGTLVTGDRFVTDAKQLENEIKQKMLNLDHETNIKIGTLMCLDMESAAVSQVCDDHKISFAAIRVISDRADHSSHVDFQKFVETIGTPFNKLIVKTILDELNQLDNVRHLSFLS